MRPIEARFLSATSGPFRQVTACPPRAPADAAPPRPLRRAQSSDSAYTWQDCTHLRNFARALRTHGSFFAYTWQDCTQSWNCGQLPPRAGAQPKPPSLRASDKDVRKTGGFLPLDAGKHPKLRAWKRHLRTFGRFSPREADKPPKLRASGGHARKRGGFPSRGARKPPKVRASDLYVRKPGGFSSLDSRKPPKPRTFGGHARKPGGFVPSPPTCGRDANDPTKKHG